MIHEHRNIIEPACLFQRIRIYIHVRSDHCDIPVAVSFFPHQTADLFCRKLRFLPGGPCLMERHRACPGLCLRSGLCSRPALHTILRTRIPEQFRFQKGHLFIMLKPLRRLPVQANRLLDLRPHFSGRSHKGCHHLLAQRKELIRMVIHKGILPLIHGHRDHHPAAYPQQFPQQTDLNRREAGKPVHGDHTVLQDLRPGDYVTEHIQHLFLCNIFLTQIIFKALINRPDILQLIIQITVRTDPAHKVVQFIKSNPVLCKLRDHRLHFTDITLFFKISPQYGKLILIIFGDLPEDEILALIVQDSPVLLPQFLKNPVSQTPET